PFGADKAAMLIKIARNKVLTNPDICRNLPASWTTLYRLARLKPELLAAGLERAELRRAAIARGDRRAAMLLLQDGTVHPEMTANDVRRLKQARGPADDAVWNPAEESRRLVQAADAWLRRCPAGEERK